jgi:hypothetical protein
MLTRVLRASVARASLLVLLLIAAGCALDRATPQASPTATPYPRPSALPTSTPGALPPAVTGPLAPAPTDCATLPAPQTFTLPPDFGGGFHSDFTFTGSSPIWALGPGSPLLVQQPSVDQPYPSTKVMWIVGPNYFQPVTLSGRELRSNAPMWFEVYQGAGTTSIFTTHATLDPGAPNRGSTEPSSGHWNIWGIGLLVLSAGCYELDVTWSGGSWRTIYAAGS